MGCLALEKGRQMYKIYINDTPLFLTGQEQTELHSASGDEFLILRYPGKKKFLLNIIDQLEKTSRFQRVVVFSDNVEKLWMDFKSFFNPISAAGGAVFNNGKVLMIYRRKFWDLPKGKIDPGESPLQAALREVEEETGLSQLEPGPHLTDTLHTYTQNKKRMLKTTHWFLMKTSQQILTPQLEEDIEQAEWIEPEEFFRMEISVYGSILDVLKKANETRHPEKK